MNKTKSRLNLLIIKLSTSSDGVTFTSHIINVIKKFSNHSVWQFVEETHVKGGPWDKTYREGEGENCPIKKETIIDYYQGLV